MSGKEDAKYVHKKGLTIDELIAELERLKKCCLDGKTPVYQ